MVLSDTLSDLDKLTMASTASSSYVHQSLHDKFKTVRVWYRVIKMLSDTLTMVSWLQQQVQQVPVMSITI